MHVRVGCSTSFSPYLPQNLSFCDYSSYFVLIVATSRPYSLLVTLFVLIQFVFIYSNFVVVLVMCVCVCVCACVCVCVFFLGGGGSCCSFQLFSVLFVVVVVMFFFFCLSAVSFRSLVNVTL